VPPRLNALRALKALLALCPTTTADILDLAIPRSTQRHDAGQYLDSEVAFGGDQSMRGVSPLLSGLSKTLVDVSEDVVKEAIRYVLNQHHSC